MVYDLNGQQIMSVYAKSGARIFQAYDINGVELLKANIRVMSYNVGQWYIGGGDNIPADKDSAYFALQSGMIEQDDPDILCLQEYWKVFSKLGRTAKSMLKQYFPYIHEQGGNSGYFGRCICSKYPISNYTVHTYSNDSNRYYDSCTVLVGSVPITVINTHLDTFSQDKRNAEIVELINYIKTQPRFIACGDFNTAITDATANTESNLYIKNVKPFIDEGFHTANFGDFGFKVTGNDGVDGAGTNWYTDNVITSRDIEVISASVDTTKLTDDIHDKVDHMPFIADLLVPYASP